MSKTSAVMRPRQLLKEEAYHHVKRMIVEGELEPGAFLSERRLGRDLGVSGSPVRAALERLGSEGLVSISPQRGTTVRDLSFNDIADQFEFRTVIETYIVQKLAGELNSKQIGQLKQQLERQRKAATAKRPNVVRNVELDMEFHLLLCEFLGNREMTTAMHQIRDKMKRAILRVNWQRDERLPKSYQEHKTIAKWIITGDARRAAREMKEHLEYGRDFLLSGGRER